MTVFKFVHGADIHLDSPLRGLSRYDSAPVDAIRDACRKAFINLVDLAIEEKAAFVLLAGDLYDGDWDDYSTGIFFSMQVGRLERQGIPVFTVAGNHDAANRMTRALENPANMVMLAHDRAQTVRLDELKVAVHGRSFPEQHVYENLAAGFPAPDRGWFNIGLLHTSLDGREGHQPYAPCSTGELQNRGYQYWALGHIHRHEIVCADPHIVFPGCIQGRHIRENGPRGCVLVTVDEGRVEDLKMQPLDVLRWEHAVVDLTGASGIRDVLDKTRRVMEAAVDAADGCPLAMRIRFEGSTPAAARLSAYPERLTRQVKALGAETVGDSLWIEKVELRAVGRADLEEHLASGSALGRLLGDILEGPADEGAVEGLDEIIADLKQKLPYEAFEEGSALDLENPETLGRLVEEARKMLAGRLLAEGGNQ